MQAPMTVLVAGGSGALGRPLLRRLAADGHRVYALARSETSARVVREAGGTPVPGDLLDREALLATAVDVRPAAIVHAATAIPKSLDPRRMSEDLAPTGRLRTEGAANAVAAAQAAGAGRLVAASIAFAYDGPPATDADEDEPLAVDAPGFRGDIARPVAELERRTLGAEGVTGVVLRLGTLYGPRTAFDPVDGSMPVLLRERKLPVLGAGTGRQSFVHVADAADAVAVALTGPSGVYNVVDDRPAPASEWIPELARRLGAPRPRHLPGLAASLAGPAVAHLMLHQRGALNARARTVLGWAPAHPDWRTAIAEAAAPARIPAGA